MGNDQTENGQELAEALPEVDLFLGVTDWVRLLELLETGN